MSVFKMGMLTLIISLGLGGYAWCNWPAENKCLNDVKYEVREWPRERCLYCYSDFPAGFECENPDCPTNK